MKKIILSILAIFCSNFVLFSQITDNVSKIKKQLDSIIAISGKESSAYALMLHQLGNAYMNIKDYDSAKKAFNESLSLKEKTLGKNTCEYARSLNNLGAIEEDLKNYDIALDYFSRAYDINKTNVKTHSDSLLFAINTTNYGRVAFNCKSYDLSIQKLQEGIKMYNNLGMSYNEYLSICTLGSIYDDLGMIKEEIENCKERLPLIKQFSDTTNYMYAVTLKLIGSCFKALGDNDSANKYFLRTINIPSYNKEDNDYYAYRELSAYSLNTGDNVAAIKFATEFGELIKNKYGERNVEYVMSLVERGDAKSNLRQDKEAIELLKKAYDIFLSIDIKESELSENDYYLYYLMILSDLGNAYLCIGYYQEGNSLIERSLMLLEEHRSIFGDDFNMLYANTLTNIVATCSAVGNYSQSLVYGSKCLSFINDNNVKMPNNIAALLYLNIGGALFFTQDYSSSFNYFNKASEMFISCGKENSLLNAQSLMGIAQVLANLNDKRCINYQVEAIRIMESLKISKTSRDLCSAYTNLAEMNAIYGDNSKKSIDMSIESLKETRGNIVERVGENSYDYARIMYELGWIYLVKKEDFKNAELCFSSSCKILESIKINNNFYISALYNLARTRFSAGEDVSNYPSILLKSLGRYVNDEYIFLPENVRRYGTLLMDVKPLLFSIRDNARKNAAADSLDQLLFNYLLKSKGIVLSTSSEIEKNITNSNDTVLLNKWNQLKFVKCKEDQLSSNILANRQDEIDSLNNVANLLEAKLLSRILNLKSKIDYLNLTYKDVGNKLMEGCLAIEFIDFKQIVKNPSDTLITKYAAMLMKKGWDKPKYIPLFDESELNSLTVNNPSNAYSANANGPKLYSLIWRKLEPYMTKGADVYFSPSGKLWTLSIENIPDGKGEVISDVYRMHRVSSTKNICIPTETKMYSNAVLYGGLAYDVNDDVLTAENAKYNSSSTLYVLRGNDIESDSTRSGWNYLTGTLAEVNVIDSELKSDNINVTLFTGNDGVEGSFKSLSGKSPDILHVATHGFFLSNTQTSRTAFFSPLADNVSVGIDPLLRSGLIMSGGNKAWKYGQSGDSNIDGILTAREINSLDFSNTDLLVLSACETGLGEVGSQGVFGLQRAFKHAGVKTIIMSLWKVNDDATRLMMQSFYSNLLKGCSMETAFNTAKAEVRKKYDSPYYWAAFIMLD